MGSATQFYPDGGYGWIIVFSSSISNFFTLSIIQCFGLILKDSFKNLKLSATQGSLIINLNASFGLLTGPLIGFLQKNFGCRKTAIMSSIFLTLGMILTSFSTSFETIVLSFGILTALGMQMSESTQRLAINQYFKKKRSLVTGFVMTIAGFGPILIPQLLRFLLAEFTPQQVTLIFAGICSHVFIASALLQPIEWHTKQLGTKEEQLEMTVKTTITKSFVKNFDLDLLKDPIFLNILIGVSLATAAELNFTVLIPFILQDYELSTEQIANFLTTLGIADLISRFLGPYIGNYFTKPSRLMFVYSLIILILIRFMVIIFDNYYILLVIGFTLGMAKGIRKVYMWLVIPDYVPLDKLPSASGMDMLARGFCIVISGPILGFLRDITGSYVICVIVMNFINFITIALWGIEAIVLKYKKKKEISRSY